MRKKKVFIWISLTILTIVILTFVFRERLVEAFLFKDLNPREPKNQIETTYNLGWWANQDNMRIDSFSVEIIESRLNLFNSYSLIKYTIKGELKGKNNWKPFVDKIHLSERFIRIYNRELHPYLDKDTCQIPEAIIEITPVIDTKEDDNYKGETIPFKFTNELKLESFHWGNNWLRFQCENMQKDIILQQTK
jgi:hypothetical protein